MSVAANNWPRSQWKIPPDDIVQEIHSTQNISIPTNQMSCCRSLIPLWELPAFEDKHSTCFMDGMAAHRAPVETPDAEYGTTEAFLCRHMCDKYHGYQNDSSVPEYQQFVR